MTAVFFLSLPPRWPPIQTTAAMPFDLIVRVLCVPGERESGQRSKRRRAKKINLPSPSPSPQSGVFIPEKSNIWRDCVDGYYDWVKEHILEVREGGEERGGSYMCVPLRNNHPTILSPHAGRPPQRLRPLRRPAPRAGRGQRCVFLCLWGGKRRGAFCCRRQQARQPSRPLFSPIQATWPSCSCCWRKAPTWTSATW